MRTAQVTEQEFDRVFIPHLEKGEDVIYISCSSALSASVKLAIKLNNENLVKAELTKINNNLSSKINELEKYLELYPVDI